MKCSKCGAPVSSVSSERVVLVDFGHGPTVDTVPTRKIHCGACGFTEIKEVNTKKVSLPTPSYDLEETYQDDD